MSISKKTIKDIDFKGKRVLMRVDFNVPIKNSVIQDDTRITAAIPSIKYVLENGAKSLVLMSHLGDPKKDTKKAKEKAEKAGKPFQEEEYLNGQHRMAPIGAHLAKLLGKGVQVSPSCTGAQTEALVNGLGAGEIALLENTRFHKEETSDSAEDREISERARKVWGCLCK
jgi:phosphoglycerate kinase